jgi:hypothetical protein
VAFGSSIQPLHAASAACWLPSCAVGAQPGGRPSGSEDSRSASGLLARLDPGGFRRSRRSVARLDSPGFLGMQRLLLLAELPEDPRLLAVLPRASIPVGPGGQPGRMLRATPLGASARRSPSAPRAPGGPLFAGGSATRFCSRGASVGNLVVSSLCYLEARKSASAITGRSPGRILVRCRFCHPHLPHCSATAVARASHFARLLSLLPLPEGIRWRSGWCTNRGHCLQSPARCGSRPIRPRTRAPERAPARNPLDLLPESATTPGSLPGSGCCADLATSARGQGDRFGVAAELP